MRELRRAGEKEAADEVKGLRKPSVSAWAVNQAARRRPQDVKALVRAGAELRKAQRAAISGRGPSELREATRTHRGLVEDLTETAREALQDRGAVSPSVLLRIAQTLRAASVDKEAAKRLTAGVLQEDVEQSGFGPLLSVVPGRRAKARNAPRATPEPKPKPKPKPKAKAKPKPDPNVARLAKLREQLAQAQRDARRERREADRVARLAEKAEERLRALQAKIERITPA